MNTIKILFFLLMILLYDLVSAQGFQMEQPPDDKGRVDLVFMHPFFDNVEDLSFLSGVYRLDISFPVSSKLNLVLGFPFSTWSYGDRNTEQGFGNLFAGIQTRSADTTGLIPSGTFGIHIPTASEDEWVSNFTAAYTDYQHFHRYFADWLTIIANGNWYKRDATNSFFGLEFGARFWVPTGSTNSDSDIEVVLNYGANGGVEFDPLMLTLEVVGQFLLSSESEETSDKFTHTLSFGLDWNRGNFNPALFYSLYLKEDLSDLVTGVLGIRLSYHTE